MAIAAAPIARSTRGTPLFLLSLETSVVAGDSVIRAGAADGAADRVATGAAVGEDVGGVVVGADCESANVNGVRVSWLRSAVAV